MRNLLFTFLAFLPASAVFSEGIPKWDNQQDALTLIRKTMVPADCLTLANYYLETAQPAKGAKWLLAGCLMGSNRQCHLAAFYIDALPASNLEKKQALSQVYKVACYRKDDPDSVACSKFEELLH